MKKDKKQKVIKERLKNIQKASVVATSFKGICMRTELSYFQVKLMLEAFPDIDYNVRMRLALNRNHQTLSLNNFSKIKDITNGKLFKGKQFIMLDASIMGVLCLRDLLKAFLKAKKTLLLNSVTKRQLESMISFNDSVGDDAAFVLSLFKEFSNLCLLVNIDESYQNDTECILQYCYAHRADIILLTSNKMMSRDAGCYGIPFYYIPYSVTAGHGQHQYKVVTFIPARKFGDKLIVSLIPNSTLFFKLFSGNNVYELGTHELKVGDNILMVKKSQALYHFAHYRIISLNMTNNSELIYGRQITRDADINKLPLRLYTEFIKDFESRYNISLE